MSFNKAIICVFFLGLFPICVDGKRLSKPIEFTIIIPTYNNEKWCIANLESAINQDYPVNLFNIIIVEDNSTDKTYKLLKEYIEKKKLDNRVSLKHNSIRQGALKNWYNTIHSCPPHKVIVNLDGDDFLSNNQVLKRVAKEYSDGVTWLSYGQYIAIPGNRLGCCRYFPDHIIKNNLFRHYEWVSSHLRTFYAELFQKLNVNDFIYNGDFYRVAPDYAFMFSLLEKARLGHIKFIPDILYVYNQHNPLNEYKIDVNYVIKIGKHIRARKPCMPEPRLNCIDYYRQ